MPAVECVTGAAYTVGESPVWHAPEAALYWVDIPMQRIHRLQVNAGRLDSWAAPEMVACIAFAAGGGLVGGAETGLFRLSLEAMGTARFSRLASPEWPMAGMRFNDGRCDRQGRFWAGTMHRDMAAAHAVGALYRYDTARGLSGPFAGGLLTQNGLAWSPAGDRMYLSDSHPLARTIWVYDYDPATGEPSNRRVFVDMNLHPGRPDGAAVDADGCYWTCANDAGMLHRFTPDGRLDRSFVLPVRKPSMCAFGGAGMDTLYVTSIRPGAVEELRDQPLAGAIFALRPGVSGVAETLYGAPLPA